MSIYNQKMDAPFILSRLRGRGNEDLAACCLVAVGEGLFFFLSKHFLPARRKTLTQPSPVKTGEG
jgi:hypothetical protein